MFKFISLRNKKGFSTVEVLATAFVFSIAMMAIGGIFARGIYLQRRATATQKIQENASFVLEYMAREIRLSNVRDQNSNCSATTLNLIHPVNGYVTYTLNGSTVVRAEGGVSNAISTNDVQFTRLYFCIAGSALGDNTPTRITILATIVDNSAKPMVTINLQTTVGSRVIAD